MTACKILFTLLGFTFGAAFGGLGVTVNRLNEQQFGAMYSNHRWEWLAIPSLPGELLAEWRLGYDWRFGEWWLQRYEIIGWNALFWGGGWLVFLACRRSRRCSQSTESVDPAQDCQ